MSNDEAELYEKVVLVIVITVFKRFPGTYCLIQGSCSICSSF